MKADTKIVVASTKMDTFGNQFITATDGQEYKIGVKRDHLHPLAQTGVPLILKWDNFMDKDYVSDVLQDASAPQPNPIAPVAPQENRGYNLRPDNNKDAQIARAVALKAAVELAVGGKVDCGDMGKHIVAQAQEFLPFLLGTTTLTEHVKTLVKEGELESPVVDKDALAGLAALAKDGGVDKQWLRDTAQEMFSKEIKAITELELGELTAKLAVEIERQEIPF